MRRIGPGGDLPAITLGVHDHRAEFVNREEAEIPANPFLREQHWPARIELYRQRRQQHDRAQGDQPDSRGEKIERTFERRVDWPARRERGIGGASE